MADSTTPWPRKGQQYRNKQFIPGYSPAALVIEVERTHPTNDPPMVSTFTVESNRLRTGPLIGLKGSYSYAELDELFEYMPVTLPPESEKRV